MAEVYQIAAGRKSKASRLRVGIAAKSAIAYLDKAREQDAVEAEMASRKRWLNVEFEIITAKMKHAVSREWAIEQMESALAKLKVSRE